jgi:hypothetical protein
MLPTRPDGRSHRLPEHLGTLRYGWWWPREPRLEPADELRELLANESEALLEAAESDETPDGESVVAEEELRQAAEPWLTLWDDSEPSAVLATSRFLAVVEGRRVLPGQPVDAVEEARTLVLTIDAALGQRRARAAGGFLVVEGTGSHPDDVPAIWKDVAALVLDPGTLVSTLVHRDAPGRAAVATAFLGVTTWQRACRELGVPWSALPNAVLDVAPEDASWCCGYTTRAASAPRPAAPDASRRLRWDEPIRRQGDVTISRSFEVMIDAHRQVLAEQAQARFPPMTHTDAARAALRAFYASPEWSDLRTASEFGAGPACDRVDRTRSAKTWTFALERDEELDRLITTHAEMLDGTWDDAVEDALTRYYRQS